MTSKPRQLKAQEWRDWLRMAEKTLAGAGRIAWQSPDESQVEINLFGRVTGQLPMPDSKWRNSMTWTAATLLGLSIEQGLKALAIRRSGEASATHDLFGLWEALPEEDQKGIAEEAGRFRRRTARTRFEDAPDLSEVKALVEMIHHHRYVFERTRYHLQRQGAGRSGALTENLGLWVVAVATYCYGIGLTARSGPAPLSRTSSRQTTSTGSPFDHRPGCTSPHFGPTGEGRPRSRPRSAPRGRYGRFRDTSGKLRPVGSPQIDDRDLRRGTGRVNQSPIRSSIHPARSPTVSTQPPGDGHPATWSVLNSW